MSGINDWQTVLQDLGELKRDVPLSKHTTLAVGGAASWYFKVKHREALQEALRILPDEVPLLPLGRGSNLLISDAGFDGLVLDLGNLQSMRWQDGKVWAEAGCRMSKLAQAAASHECTGLEFMATVPGDVGGGVVMNAGAFGQQVSDTLHAIDIVHRHGECETLMPEQLNMRYRHSDLPKGSVVVSACFAMQEVQGKQKVDGEAVRMRMRDMRHKRSQTQPLSLPNCGSVFKNPEGDYAARLIESVGLKGTRVGDAQISEVHANFIVNLGGAKAQDVLSLIALAQSKVQQEWGLVLEPEVSILDGLKGI